MCGEADEFLSQGNEVLVTTQEEAEIAVTGGRRPLRYEIQLDCLVPWFDQAWIEHAPTENLLNLAAAMLDEPPPPSEASCADWTAGFIGLPPKAPPAPPPPLSIPLRALGHHPGSAPLIEHLASAPRRRSGA